ncbi:MAG: Uncharacterized protein, YfiH family [Microgenomates bacterium 39_7]|nr:MAG: Uncharacterized protein, YfiH family [Microgenomates bacterium 39_7]
MITLSPFPKVKIFISEKRDGSINSSIQAQQLLQKHQVKSPICYFHHHHQANRYHYLSKSDNPLKEVWSDAVISNQEVCLVMKVADCFPIVLFSKESKVIALIHAGWKPLLQNIIALTMQDLQLQYNVSPKKIQAWIGPGIHSCCYLFKEKPIQANWPSWQCAIKRSGDFWSIDLIKFIIQELTKLGVQKNSIINFNQCTSCQSDSFFSHYQATRSRFSSGRMLVAVESLKPVSQTTNH